jgi:RNA polymerase sigma-70 factor (ECF subfamily)
MGGHQAVTRNESVDQLIERAAAGGADARSAMSALYEELNDTIHNWARRYVRDRHTSEDLAQEVWCKVAQSIRSYRPGTNAMAWLHTITKHAAVDYLRAQQRRPEEVLHADHLELDQPRQGLSPHQQAERNALAQALARQMGKLRPEQQQCLRLRFFDGCSPADTAQIMGRTEGAVRTLTVRSLRRLAQVLPAGDSSAALVEELLTIASSRSVVGVRVETREARTQHVATR